MKIAIVGTGYVGLVAGVCFADAGHEVTSIDSNVEKISSLQNEQVPFYEPGLDELFHLNRKRMRFTTSIREGIAQSSVVFVAVGTPELADGSADMAPTLNVLAEICKAATESKMIVLKSTVPIGASLSVARFCQEHSQWPMEIINNPEFLRQGSAVEDFLKPDRIVIGTKSEAARQVMQELYSPFVEKEGNHILFMDNVSAEMTKYAANSFLAIKISFINELALLADKLGADIDQVRAGFTSDSRINPSFFSPGIGYGGSCFPKDVRALIHSGKRYDLEMKLLRAADEVNERQKGILTLRLKERFGSLRGLTIGLWGLAFKPRTDDVRRAPALKIMEELFLSGAKVQAYDPVAGPNAQGSTAVPFELCPTAMAAAKDVDALLIVTEWPEFKSISLSELKTTMRQGVVFDGRNIFDPANMKANELEYYGIGRQVRGEEEPHVPPPQSFAIERRSVADLPL